MCNYLLFLLLGLLWALSAITWCELSACQILLFEAEYLPIKDKSSQKDSFMLSLHEEQRSDLYFRSIWVQHCDHDTDGKSSSRTRWLASNTYISIYLQVWQAPVLRVSGQPVHVKHCNDTGCHNPNRQVSGNLIEGTDSTEQNDWEFTLDHQRLWCTAKNA